MKSETNQKYRYVIFNTVTKRDVFGISEPCKSRARKELFRKIGRDAYKMRFEIRRRKVIS